MNKVFFALFLIISFNSFAQQGADKVTAEKFNYNITVNTPKSEEMYYLKVPSHIYENIQSNDISDVVVFNKNNEIVPFTIRRPQSSGVDYIDNRSVPFFILPDKAPTKENPEPPVEIIVDITEVNHPLSTIRVDFLKADNFTAKVSVYSSDTDFNRWSYLTTETFANLKSGKGSIIKDSVDLSNLSTTVKYIKLSVDRAISGNPVQDVTATFMPISRYSDADIMPVTGTISGKDNRTAILFDLKGKYPVEWLDFKIPDSYLLPDYAVYVSNNGEDYATLFELYKRYNYFQNPAVKGLPGNDKRYRYWELRTLDAPQSGVMADVYWRADELVFIAKGEGPYTIAYGKEKYTPDNNVIGVKLPMRSLINGKELLISSISEPVNINGGKFLPPVVIKPKDYSYIIYAVVGIVALLLTFAAFKLLRDVKQNGDKV